MLFATPKRRCSAHCGAVRRPVASKMYVFTSPSLPWAGISFPFSKKLMPAAFPAFTTISRVARTEVCAGAMRFSWATGLPSAMRESQVLSSERISRVNVAGGFAAGAEAVGLAAGRLASGEVEGLLAESVADAAAEGAGCGWVGGGVVEMGAGEDLSAGRVPAVAADAGVGKGAGGW